MSVLPVAVCGMALSIDMVTVDYPDAERVAPGLWWTVMVGPEGGEFCMGSDHG